MQSKTKEAICNRLHQQLLVAISETRDDEVEKIQEELQSTRQQLEQAKKQLVDMRKNVATYKRVMAQELGMDVNPHEQVVFGTNWRDRAQEVICLKSGMMKLVDALRQTGLSNLVDPECNPELTSASAEDLLTEKQRKSLKQIYEDYCVFRTQGEERAAESLEEYMKLKTSYQEKLKHNRIMIEEIKALKKKIDELREKAKEDKFLMQFLITRPVSDSHPVTLTLDDTNQEENSEGIEKKSSLENTELETFKAKWEANEQEKETAKEVMCQFRKRIEDTKKKIIEAERLCARNVVRMQELQRELQSLKSPKITKREREEPKVGKMTALKFRAAQDQLRIAKSENRALRKFLYDAFLFKEPDCQHLHLSLTTSVDIYRRDLEEALRQLWAKGGTTIK